MAFVNLPDWNAASLWRQCRKLLWSFIPAVALCLFFGFIKPPEPIAAFIGVLILVAVWVVLYKVLEALPKKS